MIESEEDLAVFFSDDFAQEITAITQSGESFVFKGIFDDAFFNPEIGEMEIEGTQPRIQTTRATAMRLTRGDKVVVDGKDYFVLKPKPEIGEKTAYISLSYA
jgi:hypothetical protein